MCRIKTNILDIGQCLLTRNCIDLYEYFRIYYKFKDMLYPQKDVKI